MMKTPMVRLFSSDLDGTLLGNPESSGRFARLWQQIPHSRRPLLVYNTGRNVLEVQELVELGLLPEPDYIIANVGTEIYDWSSRNFIREFEAELPAEWNQETVTRIVSQREGITAQPPSRNHKRKSSWYLSGASPETILEIEQDLRNAGEEVSLVYSSQRDLDVLPVSAGKGSALEWLCQRLEIPRSEVLVAGDSGNDTAMFQVEEARGVVPANVHPQLLQETLDKTIYQSRRPFADGVIDGLAFFDVVTTSEVEAIEQSTDAAARNLRFHPGRYIDLSPAESGFIKTGYEEALELLSRSGSRDTLEARDCLSWIASGAALQVACVRDSAKATLGALLDHLSPLGLLPVSIRNKDGHAEYPTLHDDDAISSGCLAILAIHAYFTATSDHEFLLKSGPKMQAIMDCICAYVEDGAISNGGSASTVPTLRRGTVTNSILWCRANLCYAQMLAAQQDLKRASDYFGRAQALRHISGTMIASLKGSEEALPNLDLSPADVRRGISRISPLSSCSDRYLNRLVAGFAHNVLDVEFVQTTFKGIWNRSAFRPVYRGQNETPETLLDRSIDSELGGTWVRFLHRLGYESIAKSELYTLARLNHSGETKWAFHRNYHPLTYEPLGGKLDISSAAAFIAACEEVHLA